MSSTRSYKTFATEGSLALSPKEEPARLIIIDGGRRSETSPVDEAHEAVPQSISRTFVIAAIIVIVLAFGAGLAGQIVREGVIQAAEEGMVTQAYVVHGGDSLWSIAENHPVEGLSTKDVVSYLKEENGISSSELSVGQTLEVPCTSQR